MTKKALYLVAALALAGTALTLQSAPARAQDSSYGPKVYRAQGGDKLVVASGGQIDGSAATGAFAFAEGEVATPDLDEQVERTADVTITTGQLLALNATPITIVAAPGAGKVNVLKDALLYLPYNSAAYNGIAAGEDLAIKYTNGSGVQVARIETTGFLDQASNQLRYAVHHSTDINNASDVTPAANAALVLHLLAGEIATGNSPLKLRVKYRVLPSTL